jgi:hypothetical protein
MLGSMLSSHSEILCLPESQFIIDTIQGADYDLDRVSSALILEKIQHNIRFLQWGRDLDFSDWSNRKTTVPYSMVINQIVKQYSNFVGKNSPRFWVDHTPTNMKYSATLIKIFPQAKFIHLVRDVRAVAASVLSLPWGPKSADQAAKFWLIRISHGLAAESYFGSDRVLRVKFEDLVENYRPTLDAICSFIGTEYQAGMKLGRGYKIPEFTRVTHPLVGREPYPDQASAWKDQLTGRQIEIIEYISGDMLSYLGYSPVYGSSARQMTKWEKFVSFLSRWRLILGDVDTWLRLQWHGRK